MIDTILSEIGWGGLAWLAFSTFLATTVRGFCGFGTGLIYMPMAAMVLPPVWAIITIIVFDIFGPIPLVPKAWREGNPREVARLAIGALIGIPIGLYFLTRLDVDIFRWGLSGVSIVLLILLAIGWRYRGVITHAMSYGIGALGGFMGGIAGLPGPPVIMLYMTGISAVAAVRANTFLYLFFYDLTVPVIMGVSGLLSLGPLLIGLFLVIPAMLGGLLGQWIFDPDKEILYRRIAYSVILASALIGLPLWG